jgi:hypothetical protein
LRNRNGSNNATTDIKNTRLRVAAAGAI